MTKKRLVRFVKHYFIGLVAMYLALAIVAYGMLKFYKGISLEESIKDLKLENQFGELKSFSDFNRKTEDKNLVKFKTSCELQLFPN